MHGHDDTDRHAPRTPAGQRNPWLAPRPFGRPSAPVMPTARPAVQVQGGTKERIP